MSISIKVHESNEQPFLEHSPSTESPERFKRAANFDPYKVPPDFKLAKLHGQARRVCYPIKPNQSPTKGSCPCCGLPIDNKQMELCCRTSKLYHLGVCFPIYFDYIRFCFFLLALCAVVGGIHNMYLNMNGFNCERNLQNTSFICKISFINLLDPQQGFGNLRKQSYTNIATFILLIAVFEFFRRYQKKLVMKYQPDYSIGDFALMLSNVPNNYTQDNLQDFINHTCEKIGVRSCNIIQTYFLNDLSDFAQKYKLKRELMIKKTRAPPELANKYASEIAGLVEQLAEFEKRYRENATVNSATGRVIIVLEESHTAKAITRAYKKTFIMRFCTTLYSLIKADFLVSQYLYKGHFIKVRRAPEPSDILWDNLNYTHSTKFWRKILTTFIVSIMLVIGFLVLLFLKRWLKEIQNTNVDPETQDYVSVGISLTGATLVALTNTCLGIFIRKFARYERHKTQTNYFVSTGRRLTAALFINMTLTTLLANVVYSTKANNTYSFWKISVAGLFFDIFFLFITNSYMSSIFNYFDIVWGVKLLKRRKALKDGPASKLTQIEANILFEGHPVDLALRYANVNKTAIYTAIFTPFIPIGLVFSMLGLLICFWVDKYLLLRRYVCANKISKSLANAMFAAGQWFLVAFTFGNLLIFFFPTSQNGNLVIKKFINDPHFWFSLGAFASAVLYKFVLPMSKLNKLLFSVNDTKPNARYEDVKDEFQENYETFHPVYKKQASMLGHDSNLEGEEMDEKARKKSKDVQVSFLFRSIEGYMEKSLMGHV